MNLRVPLNSECKKTSESGFSRAAGSAFDFLNHAEFADIDRHFARFIARFCENEDTVLAAALLSRAVRGGHTCLDLAVAPDICNLKIPPRDTWLVTLKRCRAIGGADAHTPLVLDGLRLYLRRYFEYERALCAAIRERAVGENIPAIEDAQQLAVETAIARNFVVISGGPGTGKTTTVLKILERLVASPEGEKPRIALAAPTGKAAARLQESVAKGGEKISTRLIAPASTLHRMLGALDGGSHFRRDEKNPLPADVVIMDEASMVPLTLMAKLFAALPKTARVILLGDRDQLASVEPGAVLGDMAEAASQPSSPIAGSFVVLRKNFRFRNDSNIFTLSSAVRDGDAERALAVLREAERKNSTGSEESRLESSDVFASPSPPRDRLVERLRGRIVKSYSSFLKAGDATAALREFQKFRVLCAMRVGPFGVESINREIEKILRQENLIDSEERIYRGLPLLVTQNDYTLKLFNGDIGLVWPDGDGKLAACFFADDGGIRRVPVARLPEHETAFAMTVHKSQGSEFDEVLFILPDKDLPVLTRELLYTGLTRARARVELWFDEMVFREAMARRTQRGSGLKDLLSR